MCVNRESYGIGDCKWQNSLTIPTQILLINNTVVYRIVVSNRLRLCLTGNHILGVCISARSLVYLFLFFIDFDYSHPVWMLAETRLDNNCSNSKVLEKWPCSRERL